MHKKNLSIKIGSLNKLKGIRSINLIILKKSEK